MPSLTALRLVRVLLSLAGCVAALAWHVGALRGAASPALLPAMLKAGILAVWLPTVVRVVDLGPAARDARGWWVVTRGAPSWIGWLAAALFLYAVVVGLASVVAEVSREGRPSDAAHAVSSGALACYAVAFVVLWAGVRRDLETAARHRAVDAFARSGAIAAVEWR